MHAIVFSGGQLVKSSLVDQAIASGKLFVAADSGADSALKLGIYPDVVVGDMDSISKRTKEKLKEKNVAFVTSQAEKDETDTELAIDEGIRRGATSVTIIGGSIGERLDHVLANVFLAYVYKIPITFVNGLQRSFLLQSSEELHMNGRKGDLLSLIPLSETSGIYTTGLQWELKNSELVFGKPRGVSNVFLRKKISVSLGKGLLFVIHTMS